MVDMPVDVMDLVVNRVEYYCVANFNNDGVFRVTVVLDNGIVIEPLYFRNDGCKTSAEMAQWLSRVGLKVLSASKNPCDHAFTLVFGNKYDETYCKVRVFSNMIRRC